MLVKISKIRGGRFRKSGLGRACRGDGDSRVLAGAPEGGGRVPCSGVVVLVVLGLRRG
jgi:hypothetical protein